MLQARPEMTLAGGMEMPEQGLRAPQGMAGNGTLWKVVKEAKNLQEGVVESLVPARVPVTPGVRKASC